MQRTGTAGLNLLLLATSLLFGLLAAEMLLRLTDSHWELERRHFSDAPTGIIYQRLDGGLHVLAPSQKSASRGACFNTAPISVNAAGMRGGNEPSSPISIALLGDSFMEALQIPDGMILADYLEAWTGQGVVNAGVSGYATTHELQSWRQRLAPLSPKLVILAVYLGNDISGNSCELSRTEPPCASVVDGQVQYRMLSQVSTPTNTASPVKVYNNTVMDRFQNSERAVREQLRRWLALYALGHDMKLTIQGGYSELTGRINQHLGLYLKGPDSLWEEAWQVMAEQLDLIKRDVEASGAKLVLLVIPEPAALMPKPSRALRFGYGSAVPADLDISLPSKRLVDLAHRLGLPALDILPVFTAYRERHSLAAPYFSFSCDGHWNPLGHKLAAAALVDFLIGLELADPSSFNLEAVQSTSPRDLLGDEAYRQIYGGGIFQPKMEVE